MRKLLKANANNYKSSLLLFLGIVLGAALVWLLLSRFEGSAPAIKINRPGSVVRTVNQAEELSFTVSDEGNGLRRLWVGLLKEDKDIQLLDKVFPGSGIFKGGAVPEEQIKLLIEPSKLGIGDGPAVLRFSLRDYSWRRWGNGNRTYIELPVTVDTRPPEIDLLSRTHNIGQGGSGVVIYRLSEPSAKSGVVAGNHYFPGHSGYFEDKQIAMAFFGLNYDQGRQTELFVRAYDEAGNSVRVGFPHYIGARTFDTDVIQISDRFLKWKMPEFYRDLPAGSDDSLVETFLKVNRDLRQQSAETIKQIGRKTDGTLHWEGPFLRLPRSSREAGFADHRSYQYDGEPIDRQVHLGIDLASVSRFPVPAGNAGRVVFAGKIGIYGRTVMIDHGFGLKSTYSHLSSIGVQKGEMVTRGQIVGRTGTSGLAGGDHLHYGMLIHDVFVNPIEWWDEGWIENNITAKIDAVKRTAD